MPNLILRGVAAVPVGWSAAKTAPLVAAAADAAVAAMAPRN